MEDQKESIEKAEVKPEDTKLSFKFSFTNPTDADRILNDAIVVFAKEHHLSASQSTCCGASKGSRKTT